MPLKIDKRHGAGMVGALIAIAAVGVLVIPISRWYLSLSDGAHHVAEQKEVQALIGAEKGDPDAERAD